MGWDEISDSAEYNRGEDRHVELVSNVLREFFDANRKDVYYSRELAVHFEKIDLEGGVYRPHHWVTINALRKLVDEGFLIPYREAYSHGEVVFYSHRSYRYPKRRIGKKIDLVDKYSDPVTCRAYGEHAELLFERAILRRGFNFVDEDFNEVGGRKWTKSNHNLDFAVEKDEITYGAEVKNTLDYIEKEELDIKLEMCEYFDITPLFIMRNASTYYIDEIVKSGGFAMIFEAQVYPIAYTELVAEIRRETLLPVMVSKNVPDRIIGRFVDWHTKQAP